ncbi:MAG: hypothetical protein LQ348_006065 [Seirophora lacunosa]|nr:MAG: hypothetical protein LQ348_006065 [Seirophora lacunosa]
MIYLECFLYERLAIVWGSRSLPSYMGPSPTELVFLFIFSVANSITLFAMAILLARNVWVLGANITTIEGWEIERHETLVRRAKARGGYLDGPDGLRLKITEQEFPYDIGIYQNAKQAMGGHFFTWLWPLASSPSNATGLDFETNGFEDPGTRWPPLDPDRIPRRQYNLELCDAPTMNMDWSQPDVQAFRERQKNDVLRFAETETSIPPRTQVLHQSGVEYDQTQQTQAAAGSGRYARIGAKWQDSEYNTLQDFGVDEEAEEEDLPLAEVLRRKKLVRRD